MAFPPANYNLTYFGPIPLNPSPLLRTLHHIPVEESHFSQSFTNILDSAVNFTKDPHIKDILDPLQERLGHQTFEGGDSNIVHIRQHRWSRRKQSSITKRSRNSKVPLPSTTDAIDSTTPEIPPTTLEASQDTTVGGGHIGGHTPLMDTRSPEHADPFESNRVRGPVAVKTKIPDRTTELPSNTFPSFETTFSPVESETTQIVVTPRMSLPSPSPGALQQLPVSKWLL